MQVAELRFLNETVATCIYIYKLTNDLVDTGAEFVSALLIDFIEFLFLKVNAFLEEFRYFFHLPLGLLRNEHKRFLSLCLHLRVKQTRWLGYFFDGLSVGIGVVHHY